MGSRRRNRRNDLSYGRLLDPASETQLLATKKITGKSDSYMAPVRDRLLLTLRLCA